jgi:hypothetical protein
MDSMHSLQGNLLANVFEAMHNRSTVLKETVAWNNLHEVMTALGASCFWTQRAAKTIQSLNYMFRLLHDVRKQW